MQLPAAAHVNGVVLDLYSIGGMPLLQALWLGIGESELGRAYLSIHIHATERGRPGPARPWRAVLDTCFARWGRDIQHIFPHSAAMTTLRFMLVEEGFAKSVNGVVTIDPMFADALRRALSSGGLPSG